MNRIISAIRRANFEDDMDYEPNPYDGTYSED